jgi:hypothetical protein
VIKDGSLVNMKNEPKTPKAWIRRWWNLLDQGTDASRALSLSPSLESGVEGDHETVP